MTFVFMYPFWPLVMAVVTTAGAMLFGGADARRMEDGRPTGEWLKRGLFYYAMPFLFVGFLAVCVIFAYSYDSIFYGPAIEIGRCHDTACREAVRADHANDYNWMLAKLVGVQGGLFVGMFALLSLRRFAAYLFKPSGKFNPNKWHYSEASGEFFRVLRYRGDQVIFDSTPYTKRMIADEDRKQNLVSQSIKCLVSFIVGFVAMMVGYMTPYGDTRFSAPLYITIAKVVMWGCVILFPIFVLLVILTTWGRMKNPVGPKPVQARGKEDVDQEKAYGDARAANLQDIHTALGGGKAGPFAPNGPIFED